MAYQGYQGQEYPVHVPPSMQHRPKPTRRRRAKPPASLSKLERPLTRFYCNDCKKKFRSRILANRNNNAVQHYCSLYQKIITRKVDSHSNKCKGDHGMGPCVVKRTDVDPDSDGEDETKAAYYADKGKRPRATPSKRKLRDRDVPNSTTPTLKRQRIDTHHHNQHQMPPPPAPEYNHHHSGAVEAIHQPIPHGYYAQQGYMTQSHVPSYPPPPPYQEYTANVPPPPPHEFNDVPSAPPMEHINESSMPPPPSIINGTDRTENGGSITPSAIPMPLSTEDNHNRMMSTQNDGIPPRIEDGLRMSMNEVEDEMDSIPPPPPPPLEEFEPLPIDDETNTAKQDESQTQDITVNHSIESTTTTNGHSINGHNGLSLVEVKDNNIESMITLDGGKVNGHNAHNGTNGHKQEEAKEEVVGKSSQSADDDDCINVSDDEEKPESKEPAPSSNTKEDEQEEEDEDDDLVLIAPE